MALRYWMSMLRNYADFNEGITSYPEKRPPRFAHVGPVDSDRSSLPHFRNEGRYAT